MKAHLGHLYLFMIRFVFKTEPLTGLDKIV